MHGTVVVITGASSGIGAAAASAITGRGGSVALVARRATELNKVAEQCGPNALSVVADVTREADVQRAAQAAIERFGHVDVWINNVGRGITRAPSQLTDADLDDMIQINIKSMMYGVRAILPHFKERNAGQIINVSSMLGRIPFAVFRSAYNGAKHFVNAITWNLRDELRESHPGITISLVSPPVVATEFGLNALHGGPDSRSLPAPQDVAEVGEVMAWTILEKKLDVYTRPGSKARVTEFFASVGEDPPAAVIAGAHAGT